MFSKNYTKFSNKFFDYNNQGSCLKIIVHILSKTQKFHTPICYISTKNFLKEAGLSKPTFLRDRKILINDKIIICENNYYSFLNEGSKIEPITVKNDTDSENTVVKNDTTEGSKIEPITVKNDTDSENTTIYTKRKETITKERDDVSDNFFKGNYVHRDVWENLILPKYPRSYTAEDNAIAYGIFSNIKNLNAELPNILKALENFKNTSKIKDQISQKSEQYIMKLQNFLSNWTKYLDKNNLPDTYEIIEEFGGRNSKSGAAGQTTSKGFEQKELGDVYGTEALSLLSDIKEKFELINQTLEADHSFSIENACVYDYSWIKEIIVNPNEFMVFEKELGFERYLGFSLNIAAEEFVKEYYENEYNEN